MPTTPLHEQPLPSDIAANLAWSEPMRWVDVGQIADQYAARFGYDPTTAEKWKPYQYERLLHCTHADAETVRLQVIKRCRERQTGTAAVKALTTARKEPLVYCIARAVTKLTVYLPAVAVWEGIKHAGAWLKAAFLKLGHSLWLPWLVFPLIILGVAIITAAVLVIYLPAAEVAWMGAAR